VPCPSSTGFIVAIAKAERRQLVGRLADRDGPVLQPFEKRALRLERDAVDLVEQDHFGRRERTELGHELAGRRVDHLKADDLGGLQIRAALQTRERRVADGGEDHAEERLADPGTPRSSRLPAVDLSLFVLVVGGRNLRQQHDVGERLLGVVADERVPRFGHDGLVQVDGFLEFRMHELCIIPRGSGSGPGTSKAGVPDPSLIPDPRS
jgi:hypothetical protein